MFNAILTACALTTSFIGQCVTFTDKIGPYELEPACVARLEQMVGFIKNRGVPGWPETVVELNGFCLSTEALADYLNAIEKSPIPQQEEPDIET